MQHVYISWEFKKLFIIYLLIYFINILLLAKNNYNYVATLIKEYLSKVTLITRAYIGYLIEERETLSNQS